MGMLEEIKARQGTANLTQQSVVSILALQVDPAPENGLGALGLAYNLRDAHLTARRASLGFSGSGPPWEASWLLATLRPLAQAMNRAAFTNLGAVRGAASASLHPSSSIAAPAHHHGASSASAATCFSTTNSLSLTPIQGGISYHAFGARYRSTPMPEGSRVSIGFGLSPSRTPSTQHCRSYSAFSSKGNAAVGDSSSDMAQAKVVYSPLHHNIEAFCKEVVPTEEEKKTKQMVIEGIRQGTKKAFPDMHKVRVQVFGSFANGLSTWNSDVDLVVTGMMEPDRLTGGYDVTDRGRVAARLRRIADQVRQNKKLQVSRVQVIARARLPIIKLRTKSNVDVDVSISDDGGSRAAKFMVQQSQAYPSMRPLVLVLKAFLKSQGLNDVANGGLSSYSLCNMVIAHLQEDLKAGRDVFDLGEGLYGFLLRFGEEFNYEVDAVSISNGGVVRKAKLSFATDSARFAASVQAMHVGATPWYERLCVDCPLAGRDVSNGTYRIDLVRDAFYRASRKLEALARGRMMSDTSINYLAAMFDVQKVLRRSSNRDQQIIEKTARPWERRYDSDSDDSIELEIDEGDLDDELLEDPSLSTRW
eukprot:gene5147-34957_t